MMLQVRGEREGQVPAPAAAGPGRAGNHRLRHQVHPSRRVALIEPLSMNPLIERRSRPIASSPRGHAFHVTTRAESATGTGYDHHPHVGGSLGVIEHLLEPGGHAARHGIPGLRPIQGEHNHTVIHVGEDIVRPRIQINSGHYSLP